MISGYSEDDLRADEKVLRRRKREDPVMRKYQHSSHRRCIPQTQWTQLQQLPWPLSVSDNGRSLGHNDWIIQCHMFSHFHTVPQSFPLLSHSLSHPLILPLCLCEEACLPAGPGCRDARLKSPRGERFLNPSCPPGLMQCISLLLGVFVRHSRRFITSDPSNDSLWASHPTYNPVILWVLLSSPPG